MPKLPDRTPVKLTISVMPDLHQTLTEYAAAYEATYGQRENIADLVPFTLASFLESDRAFAKRRRAGWPKMRDRHDRPPSGDLGPNFITVGEFAQLARLSRRQIDRLRKRRPPGFPREYELGKRRMRLPALPAVQTVRVQAWLDSRALW